MGKWREWLGRAMVFSLRDTLAALGILLSAAVLCFALQVFDFDTNSGAVIFILAVFLVARITEGYFYGIAASFCAVLLVNFLFTYPYYRFNFTLAGYPVTIVCMLAVSVTTSTLTTRAKRSAEARLEAEREKTRSNLLRAVSHDLRTPLTSILGASSAILENDGALTREERLALLQDVRDDAQWLIRMVENLLTITRMDDSGGARVVKAPEAGEEILEAAVAKFKKQLPQWRVSVRAPEEFLMIPMDAVLIGQVLMNLMENAAHHGIGADRIDVSLERRGNSAVFTVQDNGCGIDPALLPRIFESRPASGSGGDSKRNMGIGLSVCYTIIRAHNGTMEAENKPEGGAVFRFSLPLEEEYHES